MQKIAIINEHVCYSNIDLDEYRDRVKSMIELRIPDKYLIERRGKVMKKIECFQPRGLAKILCILLCGGMIIDCACMTTAKNSISEGVVFAVAFGMPILLTIFGIFVYKISAVDNQIIIRKWYGRSIKVGLKNVTMVVMASSTGKAIDASRIHIYIGKTKILSLDPILENYEEMKKYIINNVDETKIDIIS